jgi:KipI family sensor histidine kinase inhibitor
MGDFEIVAGGDACLAIVFPPAIDEILTLRCASIARAIESRHVAAIRDIVPTFHTVAVYFDPRLIHRGALETILQQCAGAPVPSDPSEGPVIEVPVRYGGTFGPDLPAVASFGGCTELEAARLHSARLYRVFMLGFLPGFAYMGQVDERIAAPRLDTPRARVTAGSVAIAGRQTAIYPVDSPGGWQIIGRTSLRMFDPDRPNPFLLQSADRVRFVPVDAAGIEQPPR